MSIPTKPIVISPFDKELIAAVKFAACLHFNISEEDLVNDRSPAVATVRHLCFWLILKNTTLKDYTVAAVFNRTRTAVNHGIDLIEIHKKIYRQTIDNLRAMAKIADTFDKKFQWHIQQINTAN